MYWRYAGPLPLGASNEEFRRYVDRGWLAWLASEATRYRCARCCEPDWKVVTCHAGFFSHSVQVVTKKGRLDILPDF